MNFEVENFTFSETWPGALKAKDGTPSAENCLARDSLNLDFPEPGIPETIMILLFPWGSPAFSFSTRS
jgi:hypothetical protein